MTPTLSEPMRHLLKCMGKGHDYDDFGVHGPLSLAARVRTCKALEKRGLMVQTLFGHFELTDAGEASAKQLNDQESSETPERQLPDWQIVQRWPGFVVEANCNGGGHRRVYPDGRVVLIEEGAGERTTKHMEIYNDRQSNA